MRGAWSRPPAPRASRPCRPRAGGRDRGELPGRAQHLRKLAEKFENEKSNRLSASALPMTLQPRHILDKRCLFYQQSDDGEDGDGGVYGWSKLGGHVPSPLYLSVDTWSFCFLFLTPRASSQSCCRTAPVLKSEMLTLMHIIKESKFSEELPPTPDSFPQPLPGVGISYLYRTMYHIEKFCLFPSKPLHRLSDLPVPDKGYSCRGRTSVSGGRR
ncbi:hypothetical protein CapIbe_010125 [Capra ibex]